MSHASDRAGRANVLADRAKERSLCGVSDVTRVVEAIQRGDPQAADQLLPLVYEELRKLAASKMANEAAGNTLQPTALVHEAWLRPVGNGHQRYSDLAKRGWSELFPGAQQ